MFISLLRRNGGWSLICQSLQFLADEYDFLINCRPCTFFCLSESVDILTTSTRVKERKLIDYNMIDWCAEPERHEKRLAECQTFTFTSPALGLWIELGHFASGKKAEITSAFAYKNTSKVAWHLANITHSGWCELKGTLELLIPWKFPRQSIKEFDTGFWSIDYHIHFASPLHI